MSNATDELMQAARQINYRVMIDTLRAMDEEQLYELFKDIDDNDTVLRIQVVADKFMEDYAEAWDEEHGISHHESDEKDLKTADDAQRTRDIQDEQRNNYE